MISISGNTGCRVVVGEKLKESTALEAESVRASTKSLATTVHGPLECRINLKEGGIEEGIGEEMEGIRSSEEVKVIGSSEEGMEGIRSSEEGMEGMGSSEEVKVIGSSEEGMEGIRSSEEVKVIGSSEEGMEGMGSSEAAMSFDSPFVTGLSAKGTRPILCAMYSSFWHEVFSSTRTS